MSAWVYAASPASVGELLDGGGEFVAPPQILSDLTEAQAVATPPGSPHSIAQILNHMHFWQSAELAKARGQAWTRPAHLDDTFAPIAPRAWQTLVADFLAGIADCKQLAQEKAEEISPARDDTSLTYDLAESALHNAYHLGQIVLLRQMQGWWPPAEGDSNDF